MASTRPYAEGTTVPITQSQTEIQNTLRRYGASGFMVGFDDDQAAVAFKLNGLHVRFTLRIPTDPDEFARTRGGQRRAPAARATAMDAETRRLWRALALAIKAKLEAVDSGIVTFEEEFLAHIVLPDGRAFAEHAMPAIQQAYANGGVPRLALEAGAS